MKLTNRSGLPVMLHSGRVIPAGAEGDGDPDNDHDAALLAAGVLAVVDQPAADAAPDPGPAPQARPRARRHKQQEG